MDIPESRKLEITLPGEVPVGEADLVMTVTPRNNGKRSTAKDLLSSEILGMWADRDDIEDSAALARELRERAWKRSTE